MKTSHADNRPDDEAVLERNIARLIACSAPLPAVAESPLLGPVLEEVRRQRRRLIGVRLALAAASMVAVAAVVAVVVSPWRDPSQPPAQPLVAQGKSDSAASTKGNSVRPPASPPAGRKIDTPQSKSMGAPSPSHAAVPPSETAKGPTAPVPTSLRDATAPSQRANSRPPVGVGDGPSAPSVAPAPATFKRPATGMEPLGPETGDFQRPGPKPGPKPHSIPKPKPGTGAVALNTTPAIKDPTTPAKQAGWVLYVSAGSDASEGAVYQLDETGSVLGKVETPTTATGMAIDRGQALVLAMPRAGGKIVRIDGTGRLSTLLEKDPELRHPVDLAMVSESSAIVVADNNPAVLADTTTSGTKPRVFRRFEGQKWSTPEVSVAVTNDGRVLFSSSAEAGVFRFGRSEASPSSKPVLPAPGGVAADPKSLRWAAGQEPNQICLCEGDELLRKLVLPQGKSLYRRGVLSFAPGGLCVAARNADQPTSVWLLMYDFKKDKWNSLFRWENERGPIADLVVGPRMAWERSPSGPPTGTY
jgi:hypothetical protein